MSLSFRRAPRDCIRLEAPFNLHPLLAASGPGYLPICAEKASRGRICLRCCILYPSRRSSERRNVEVLNVWPVTRTRPGDPNDANHGQDVVGGLSGWLVKSSWTGLRPWTAVSRYPPQASWVQQSGPLWTRSAIDNSPMFRETKIEGSAVDAIHSAWPCMYIRGFSPRECP